MLRVPVIDASFSSAQVIFLFIERHWNTNRIVDSRHWTKVYKTAVLFTLVMKHKNFWCSSIAYISTEGRWELDCRLDLHKHNMKRKRQSLIPIISVWGPNTCHGNHRWSGQPRHTKRKFPRSKFILSFSAEAPGHGFRNSRRVFGGFPAKWFQGFKSFNFWKRLMRELLDQHVPGGAECGRDGSEPGP